MLNGLGRTPRPNMVGASRKKLHATVLERHRTILILLVIAMNARAAATWERLGAIQPGDRVTVSQMDRREYHGNFLRFSPDAIVIRADGRDLEIVRGDVQRVQAPARGKRLRNILIGASIGLAGAVALDKTLGSYLNNEGHYGASSRAVVWAAPIGVGAAIGAVPRGVRTVYEVKRR